MQVGDRDMPALKVPDNDVDRVENKADCGESIDCL